MLSSIRSVGQSFEQPRASIQGFGRSVVRPSRSSRSVASSSFGTQGVQRPQKTQTLIFSMTTDEAQANPNIVSSIMFVFGTLARFLFYSRSSRSFVNTAFALHANWELALLKNKLVVTTPFGEQILHTSVLKGCEVLVEGVVLKANLSHWRCSILL